METSYREVRWLSAPRRWRNTRRLCACQADATSIQGLHNIAEPREVGGDVDGPSTIPKAHTDGRRRSTKRKDLEFYEGGGRQTAKPRPDGAASATMST